MNSTNLSLHLQSENGTTFHLSESGIRFTESGKTGSVVLSNFCLLVQDFFILIEESNTSKGPLFRLSVTQESETSLLPDAFSTQSLRKWLKAIPDPRLTIFPERKAIELIIDSVRLQLRDEPRKVFSVAHTGWNRLGDRWAYVLREKIFLPSDIGLNDVQSDWKLQAREEHFAVDDADNERLQSAAYFLSLARSIPQVTAPLCLYLILMLLYTRLIRLGIFPDFWLWVAGPSGSGKTSICEQSLCFLSGTGRKAFTVSLTSTSAGLNHLLASQYDLPLILDDYSTSEGTKQQRGYQDVIDATMRHATNGTGRYTRNGFQKDHCLAVVTAEMPLQKYSMASRALSVFVPTGINFSLLDRIQEDSHFSSFIDHFLAWLVAHPDIFQIFESGKTWILSPDHHRPYTDARLTSHTRFLHAAHLMLRKYLQDIKFPESSLDKEIRYLSTEVQKLGEINTAFLQKLKQSAIIGDDAGWIPQLSRALLGNGAFVFGKNANSLTDVTVDACWHQGNIAVKPQAILRFLRQTFPEGAWDTQTVYRALAAANLVKPGKDGKTTRVIGRCCRVLVFETENLRLHAAASL
ncbi:hypothetical protein WMO24_12085 [Ruthenibacterium sp. CLA-JM-H11]|uniref:DUF927 domain-containing protein n=2 Tax=Ruthenibacterium intestinale TaxID=3133163 RepID=A0ABV1GHG2_9FIRM